MFTLGKDVVLRSVLGLSSLLEMGATLNLPLGKLVCSGFNFTFLLLLDPPGMGLPDGVYVLNSKISTPRGIPSNLNSLIQYTTMDGETASSPNKETPSDCIVVHDSFFQKLYLEHYP